ncbi:MAG TPA: glycosyltransferase family 4 protein [Gemmatimonadaceae bacterium]
MQRPTRVLFIIYGLAPAGPELRLLEFARHFPATTEVHLCVIGDDLTLLEEFRKTPARIAIVPVRRPWVEWGQLRRVLAYIRTHDIAVVNSFNLKTLIVAVAAKLRFGRRIKLVHHLISLWDGLRDHHKRMVWHSLRYADVVVCNGYAVRDTLIGPKKIKPRVVVVPNGVDGEHFRPMPDVRLAQRQRLGLSDDHFVFGTVANVRPVKNYPLLLNTIRRIGEVHPRVRLVCVGGGPQLEEMQALASRLGVGDKVIWTGQTTDVRPFVATFDAFALTSFKEGCPNALMQAMAMGIPSMSSQVGEVPHLTEGGRCGLMFDPNDSYECYDVAVRLIEDGELRQRLAREGRARMEEQYSNPRMIRDYVELFGEVSALPR